MSARKLRNFTYTHFITNNISIFTNEKQIYSGTSTNGHLSTTATSLQQPVFNIPEVQFYYYLTSSLQFPPFNSHFFAVPWVAVVWRLNCIFTARYNLDPHLLQVQQVLVLHRRPNRPTPRAVRDDAGYDSESRGFESPFGQLATEKLYSVLLSKSAPLADYKG